MTAVAGLYVGCQFSPLTVRAQESPPATAHADVDDPANSESADEAVMRALFETGSEETPEVEQVGGWNWRGNNNAEPTSKPTSKPTGKMGPFGRFKKQPPTDPFLDSEPGDEEPAAAHDPDLYDDVAEPPVKPTDRKGTPRTERSNRRRLLQHQPLKSSAEPSPAKGPAASNTQRLAPQRATQPTVEQDEPEGEETPAPAETPDAKSEEELRSLFENTEEPAAPAPRSAAARAAAKTPVVESEAAPPSAPKPTTVPPRTTQQRPASKQPTIPIEEFDAPNPARVKAREQRKRTKPTARVTQTNAKLSDEPAARAKVDQADATQTVTAPLPPGIKKLPELKSVATTKPLPELKSTNQPISTAGGSNPAIVEAPVIRAARSGNSSPSATQVPPNVSTPAYAAASLTATRPCVLANRAIQIEPPPGWSAATKLAGHHSAAPTIPAPVGQLDQPQSNPRATAPPTLELPSYGAPESPDQAQSAKPPALLDTIEAVNAVQYARALGKSPAGVHSALFVQSAMEGRPEPTRIPEAHPDPVVIPALAAQNHSPWRWWILSAFAGGCGISWLCSRLFRRSETY